MEANFLIASTDYTPEVTFDKEKSLFRISGDMLPENSFDFFDPIFNWIKQYTEKPDKKIDFEFNLNIINSSSTRRLVYFFKYVEKIIEKGVEVKVIWILLPEDEVMQCVTYEFQKIFKKINFIIQSK